MKRFSIFLSLFLSMLLLGGCGGTTGGSQGGGDYERSQNYNNGAIALWDYLVPASDTTNSYIKTNGTTSQTYRTRYTREANRVTEVSNLSENEKTIYTKNANDITISFYTDGAENGRLELKPTVDIGERVTIKKSDCRLAKVWDTFHYQNRDFKDVIEIRCGNTPGYYQRGVGEIAQEQKISEKGTVETKYLAGH